MQKEDRMARARAVRRRMADLKMAEELRSRGFRIEAPDDDVQKITDGRSGLIGPAPHEGLIP